ncbi:MAG: pectate lyase, partial [Limnochordia bacterium]
FATVHLFNNYFHNIVESGINVREGGKARIENNYFENVGSGNPNPKTGMIEGPIGWWYNDTKGDWEVIGNIFVDCPVSEYESTTTVHIPYDYGMALNDAERAKELVLMYAGAGSPSLEQ